MVKSIRHLIEGHRSSGVGIHEATFRVDEDDIELGVAPSSKAGSSSGDAFEIAYVYRSSGWYMARGSWQTRFEPYGTGDVVTAPRSRREHRRLLQERSHAETTRAD